MYRLLMVAHALLNILANFLQHLTHLMCVAASNVDHWAYALRKARSMGRLTAAADRQSNAELEAVNADFDMQSARMAYNAESSAIRIAHPTIES